MLNKEPKGRISVVECLEHPWFKIAYPKHEIHEGGLGTETHAKII
jgi:serine/threonine protein kinase